MKPKLVTSFREITTLIYISNKEIRLSLFLTVVKRFFLGKLFDIKKELLTSKLQQLGKNELHSQKLKHTEVQIY